MQKNNIKGCCQADTNKKKQEKRQGPLAHKHKKTSFLSLAFSGSFSGGPPFFLYCHHAVFLGKTQV